MTSIPEAIQTFAIAAVTGKVVHVDEVANGRACGCVCPVCKGEMVAKNGGTEVTHHFAHLSLVDCPHAPETSLHQAAKQILVQEKKMLVPGYLIWAKVDLDKCRVIEEIQEPIELQFDRVVTETAIGGVISDAIGYVNDQPYLVEFAVTHFVDNDKWKKLEKLGLPSIEIDLSKFSRDLDWAALKKIIVDEFYHKVWVTNPAKEQRLRELEEKAAVAEEERAQNSLNRARQLQAILKAPPGPEQDRLRNEFHEQTSTRANIEKNFALMDAHFEEAHLDGVVEKYTQEAPKKQLWYELSWHLGFPKYEELPDVFYVEARGSFTFRYHPKLWQLAILVSMMGNPGWPYTHKGSIIRFHWSDIGPWCIHNFAEDFVQVLWRSARSFDEEEQKRFKGIEFAVYDFLQRLIEKGIVKDTSVEKKPGYFATSYEVDQRELKKLFGLKSA